MPSRIPLSWARVLVDALLQIKQNPMAGIEEGIFVEEGLTGKEISLFYVMEAGIEVLTYGNRNEVLYTEKSESHTTDIYIEQLLSA